MDIVIAQNPRFIIRQFLPEEEGIYVELLADAEVALYLPKRTKEENQQIFKTALQDYAAGEVLGKWGIFDAADNGFIGMCLLRYFDENGSVEIGYSLHKKYWGKGIATAMAKALIGYAFDRTATQEIVAVTAPENVGSQRVLEKAGLIRQENINRYGAEAAFFKLPKVD
ncbi:MAG: GNAT family N-acetyltransferase [Mucilaginibacter sp.]|uniref:GNAT family N-acetyltransferase n=1 Tax=Mucilaginibacter sp. TaxID=1882438 RepID=UPI0034E388D1